MVRKSMWAALAVLLAYAPSTIAYEYRIVQSNVSGFTYASELFGTGSATSRIDYDGDGPKVTLWAILSDHDANCDYEMTAAGCDAENEPREGDSMEVTFRLHNAVFSTNVRGSNEELRTYHGNPIGDPAATGDAARDANDSDHPNGAIFMSKNREEGGTAGSSHVVYTLTAGNSGWDGNDDGNGSPTVIELELEMPPLTGLNHARPVTVTVEVDAGGGSGFRSSGAADVVVANNGLNGTGFMTEGNAEMGMLTSRGANSDVLRLTRPSTGATATATTPRRSVPLVTYLAALTFSVENGGTSDIDITGDRMTVTVQDDDPAQSTLAKVAIGVNPHPDTGVVPLQLGGQTFSIANRQDGEGELVISVAGEFHAMGDQVWLDVDGDKMPDSGEMLMLEEGVMSGRFGLIQVAGDARQTGDTDEAERAKAEGVATRSLIFKPNGTETLRPATYTTTMSVEFDNESNRHKGDQTGIHTTRYFVQEGANPIIIGSDLTRHAYAIPPVANRDEGYVRVKCETATACPLYLECDDQRGMSWFATVRDDIGPRATLQLSSEDIMDHLEVGEDGWAGRLSCTVMSTKDISLQVLTRSGGALINNTFVDN